ncbi:MAG TPA: Crp/Fnr family transcriptional regulator [Azospirillum sp.]|nr:Crp/Fnr family transcriptional regulator [Azospirillum sp.]
MHPNALSERGTFFGPVAPAAGPAASVGSCACETALSGVSSATGVRGAAAWALEMAARRNQTVFRSGDDAKALFIVCRGLIKLAHFTRDGEQRIVRLLRPGDAFGLECLTGGSYRHTAVALRSSTLCRIATPQVERMLEGRSLAPSDLFRLWQSTVDRADELLVELGLGSSRSRVARLLLLLTDGSTEAPCELFRRDDVGAILRLTPETVSRALTEFKQAGAITQDAMNRYRCDRAALTTIASDG